MSETPKSPTADDDSDLFVRPAPKVVQSLICMPKEKHEAMVAELAALRAERDAAIREVGEWARKCGTLEAERDNSLKMCADSMEYYRALAIERDRLRELNEAQSAKIEALQRRVSPQA
jgi:hypothetical protein